MPQAGGATGWVLVHKTKGVMWNSLDLQEDRPGGLWAKLNGWRWQRVLISFDAHDDPFAMADAGQSVRTTP